MKIYAHRGFSGQYPENTMEAFLQVLKTPAEGIKLDVQLSKDGEVVVIHDETVDRTTSGSGYVKDYSLTELKKFQIHHSNCSVQTIPTLDEVLCWIQETQLSLNIELKTDRIRYEGIEEKVLMEIEKYGLSDRVYFSSFHYETVQRCKCLAPHIPAHFLISRSFKKSPLTLKVDQINGLNPNVALLKNQKRIRLYQMQGIKIYPYTINQKEQLSLCLATRCDGVITDYPVQLKEWLSQLE